MVVKLPKITYPSGVRKGIYKCDVNGKPLDLKAVNAINIGKNNKPVYISSNLTKKILKFVK